MKMLPSVLISCVLLLTMNPQHGQSRRIKIPCDVRTNNTVTECKEDHRKRMRKDLNEREQCCSLARLRHCINDAMEDDCPQDEAEETYE